MMKMPFVSKVLGAVALLSVVLVANAGGPGANILDLPLTLGPTPSGTVGDQRPVGHWVLLIVDARTPGSIQMLDLLAAHDIDPSRILRLNIGGAPSPQRAVELAERLPAARAFDIDRGLLAKRLTIPGTPALLGIAPDGSVHWQTINVPADPHFLIGMLRDWTRRAQAQGKRR